MGSPCLHGANVERRYQDASKATFGRTVHGNCPAVHHCIIPSHRCDEPQLFGTCTAASIPRNYRNLIIETGIILLCQCEFSGKRVENRTVIDQSAFFRGAIDAMIKQVGRVAVVIDGLDALPGAAGGATFTSHGARIATRSVNEVEAEIAELIRTSDLDHGGVEVISTVGASMAETIFWFYRAAMFVTPWGAGLAKYSWLCNIPDLIAIGDFFTRHCDYLEKHFHDAWEYMQSPAPVVYFSPDEVEDDFSAPLLVRVAEKVRVNYGVRPAVIRRRIKETLALLRPTHVEIGPAR